MGDPAELREREPGRERRSRRVATPTPSEAADTPPSTPRSTSPSRGNRRSIDSTPSPCSTNSLSLSRLPHRLGIFWKTGQKIEAKDFLGKWYPARITEVDEVAQEVHIHFEGWNSRYDEILSMESDRLRPSVRHSERKERAKANRPAARPEHKVNECIFAKWTDCRLYAARILAVNSNGSYEVLFYDGFKKTVQPINVKSMSPEVQAEYQKAGILPPPIKKTKLKGSPTATTSKSDDERDGSRERSQSEGEGKADIYKRNRYGYRKFTKDTLSESVTEESVPEDTTEQPKGMKRSADTSPSSSIPPGKKRKLSAGGAGKGKHRDSGKGIASPAMSLSEEDTVDTRSPAPESVSSSASVKDESIAPEQTAFNTGGYESENPTEASQCEHDGPTRAPATSSTPQPENMAEVGGATLLESCQSSQPGPSQPVKPAVLPPGYKYQTATGMDGTKAKSMVMLRSSIILWQNPRWLRVSMSKKKRPETVTPLQDDTSKSWSVPARPCQPRNPGTTKRMSSVWAPKEFKIQDDHNQFKCPWESCSKGFRKMVLLESHLKHYHNEDGTPKAPPPARPRKKTISVCSTDSDISVGGKSTGARSRRRESQVSVCSYPEISQDGSTGSVEEEILGNSEPLSISVEEKIVSTAPVEPVAIETSRHGNSARGHHANTKDVVNCICQINEENGLMIQCEVCLCWQHAMCMEITEETLPKKYICYVCQNPPGVRDSARFMFIQDWHRDGVMPCYGFLPPVPENERRSPPVVQGTHDLVGDMHNVSRVLRALRREIHVLHRHDDHPELQLWTKNWDRETKTADDDKALQSVKLEEVKPLVAAPVKLEVSRSESEECRGPKFETNEEKRRRLLESIRSEYIEEEGVNSDKGDDDTDEERTDGEKESGETTDEAEETLRHEAALREQELREQGLHQSGSATELHDYFSTQEKPNLMAKKLSAVGRAASTDTEELESDVSVSQNEDDPFSHCERHLLQHIMSVQDNVEARMDLLEEEVSALEALTPTSHGRDVLTEIPNLKRLIHQLINDLDKVKRMARYH